MHSSKSSAIEDILSKSDDDHFEFEAGAPGRKPASKNPPKPTGKASARNTQAWRAIEDMKDSKRLDRKLKEVYDEK
jgi:hypothetical protein